MTRCANIVAGCALVLAAKVCAADAALADAVKNHRTSLARVLLARHADVNAAQGDGSTALHWAVHWDDQDLVSTLVRAGANVNAATDLGVTPLFLACENHNGRIVEALAASGASVKAALPDGETVLMACARTGDVQAVTTLLARGADVNAKQNSSHQTALMWAAAQQHPDVVRLLIQRGADVHARSRVDRELVARKMPKVGEERGHTSAEWIDRGGSTPLLFAARAGSVDSARWLLDGGADVNEAAPDGNTALLIAAHSSHTVLAKYLLDRGADPNASGIGYSALHSAVLRGDTELVQALLAHRANPNARLTNGTPIRRTDPDGLLPADLAGATPFLLASRFVDVKMMRLLADAGADTTIAMADGTTPLMVIAGVRWDNGFERKGAYIVGASLPADEVDVLEAARLAIALHADPNARNAAGDAAIHGAASKGYTKLVELLANAGANVDARNQKGQTPLSVARVALAAHEAALKEMTTVLSKFVVKQ